MFVLVLLGSWAYTPKRNYRNVESSDIDKTIKGLSENKSDNSKIEKEVQKEVISLCSSFPIYDN